MRRFNKSDLSVEEILLKWAKNKNKNKTIMNNENHVRLIFEQDIQLNSKCCF